MGKGSQGKRVKKGRPGSRSSVKEERRVLAARSVVDDGELPEVVARVLGVSRSSVFSWAKKYREGGEEALSSKPVPGRPTLLTEDEQAHIIRLVVGKNPDQLQFDFGLWTRGLVRSLVWREYKVDMSLSAVGAMLHRWGLSPQKPLRRAVEQDPALVERWKTVDYPAIKALAAEKGATIYFGDEAAVRSDYHSGTTWSPVGETPIVRATGKRFKVNMISAIAPGGATQFDVFEGNMNAERFIEFCEKLVLWNRGPVFLIVDNVQTHKAKKVQEYVKSTNGRLALFYLPPYSPELNPDEWVWKHVKHDHIGKLGPDTLRTDNDLHTIVWRTLNRLTKCPAFVRTFFRDPDLAYINAA